MAFSEKYLLACLESCSGSLHFVRNVWGTFRLLRWINWSRFESINPILSGQIWSGVTTRCSMDHLGTEWDVNLKPLVFIPLLGGEGLDYLIIWMLFSDHKVSETCGPWPWGSFLIIFQFDDKNISEVTHCYFCDVQGEGNFFFPRETYNNLPLVSPKNSTKKDLSCGKWLLSAPVEDTWRCTATG